MSGAYVKVYEIVRKIPPGKVLTYGLISTLLGGRLSAQGVGWALKALASKPAPARKPKQDSSQNTSSFSANNVPWHRVINSQGTLSTYKNPEIPPRLQQTLLEKEGVAFDKEGRLDLNIFLWKAGLAKLAHSSYDWED